MQTSILPYMLKFPAPTRDLHPPSPSVYHAALASNHQIRVLVMWEILVYIRPRYIYHVFCEACPDDPWHRITITSEGSILIRCADVNEPQHTPQRISLNAEDQQLFVELLAQWDREDEIMNSVINDPKPTINNSKRVPAPFPEL
ncbi:hypothetical protein K435DRAFT_793201 [Dendrothele bispora CBS 962.96]|uniref:Uncharacterized protein n=1 Tax=Dendrothele bispora (strain CBS 962.96) TaxID=1314807 RepID=A0A4S8MGI8_DENBC|nr:hypothetical protein K435DRAFT_793201 [Dendrothele bispora CBS 962.96]